MFADWALPFVFILSIAMTIALIILPKHDKDDDDLL